MAPNESIVEWQTREIITHLLADDEETDDRNVAFAHGVVEADGPEDDHFDPVVIADRLRTVADALNEDYRFQAALSELKRAAAEEAAVEAFSHGVDALFQSQVAQQAEISPEMQLIKASVAFGLHVKKCCPDLKATVQGAMTAFLNRRVGTWVTQQGGWEKVKV